MTVLEKKVDALIRCVLTDNDPAAISDLKDLVEGKVSVPVGEEIAAFLMELDIPVGPKGYSQLVTTLELAIKEPCLLNDLLKGLYPKAAELCGTSSRRIERNIRHCIETAWEYGDNRVLERYFANTISLRTGRPSTGAFLFRATREIRRRLDM